MRRILLLYIYLQLIGRIEIEMEQGGKIDPRSPAEQLFYIRCIGGMCIGRIAVGRQMFYSREENAVSDDIPQRMHEKGPLRIYIRVIGLIFSDVFPKYDGLVIPDPWRAFLEDLLISRLTLHIPGVQRIPESADAFMDPIIGPVSGCHLIAPPLMTEFMIHQPVKILSADLRITELIAIGIHALVLHAKMRGLHQAYLFFGPGI